MYTLMLAAIIVISSYLGFALGLINQIGQDTELLAVKAYAWKLPVLVPVELIKHLFLKGSGFSDLRLFLIMDEISLLLLYRFAMSYREVKAQSIKKETVRRNKFKVATKQQIENVFKNVNVLLAT